MFKEYIPQINDTVKRTKKAIIALGCSFAQGQGAINEKIYKDYPWTGNKFGVPAFEWKLSSEQIVQLTKEYPDIKYNFYSGTNQLDFIRHEYNNSFVNVLCNKYFNDEYAAINLGQAGCGNRATIKELYFYPNILWNEIEEIIVIYSPSGLERVDFMDDTQNQSINNHGRWTCMWPNDYDNDRGRGGAKKALWEGYRDTIYSMRFEVLEQIAHIQELMLWCKFKKAKLIIVPAFSRFYDRQHFTNSLCMGFSRNGKSGEVFNEFTIDHTKNIDDMVNMWPWENMFRPEDCHTFSDLVTLHETPNMPDKHFYEYIGTGSPKGWISPCAHPGAKGHDLLAKLLHKEITKNAGQYDIK